MALLVLAGLAIGRAKIRSNYYVSSYNGTLSIMRGVQGSIFGFALHQPYLAACLNSRNELSQISYGQSESGLNCSPMKLSDLRPSGRAQVVAGLPAGSLEDAIIELRQLTATSLLPPCPPPATLPPPASAQAPETTEPPTTTALPPPPPQPGIDCRAVA